MVTEVERLRDLSDDAPTRDRRNRNFPTSSVATLVRHSDAPKGKSFAGQKMPIVGEKFANFAIVAEIGRGAFSRVYLAHQVDMANRFVALKVTLDYFDESQTLAQLQHTNIMPIYSVHAEKNLRALCMPYFGSTTLANICRELRSPTMPASGCQFVNILAKRRFAVQADELPPTVDNRDQATLSDFELPVSVPSAAPGAAPNFEFLNQFSYVDAVLWIGARLADGLAHAHERGIIHRDIKPANVLMTDDGRPMLLDFNLSTDTQTTLARGGTVPYMAPEQLQAQLHSDEEGITVQADLYSLGLVLYELLAGKPAFVRYEGSDPDTIRQMLKERKVGPIALNVANPAATPAVQSIINKCLAFDRKDRYESAGHLRADLERQLANLPLLHAKNSSIKERLSKWKRRHPSATSFSALSAVAVTMMLGLSFGVYHFWQEAAANSAQVVKKDAQAKLNSFLNQTDQLRYWLVRPPEGELRQRTFAETREALSSYGALNQLDWQADPSYTALDDADRARLRDRIAELLGMYTLAKLDGLKARPTEQELTSVMDIHGAFGSLYESGKRPRFWHEQREKLLILAGDTAGAASASQAAANASCDSQMDRYLAAVEQYRVGSFTKAINELKTIVRADPYHFGAWLVLGNCHLAMEQDFEAFGCYTTCVGLCPKSYVALSSRGRANFNLRKSKAALSDFEQAKELEASSPELAIDIAKCCVALGKLDVAESAIEPAVATDEYRLRALWARADIRKRAEDFQGAGNDLRTILDTVPKTFLDYISRGLYKEKQKDYESALADFRTAEALSPASLLARLNQSRMLIKIQGKKSSDALAVLDNLLALCPDSPKGLAGRATLLARNGRIDDALRDLKRCMKVSDSPLIHFQLAGVYALTSERPGHISMALQLIRDSIMRQHSLAKNLEDDSDFDTLRQLPEFISIAEAAKALKTTK